MRFTVHVSQLTHFNCGTPPVLYSPDVISHTHSAHARTHTHAGDARDARDARAMDALGADELRHVLGFLSHKQTNKIKTQTLNSPVVSR